MQKRPDYKGRAGTTYSRRRGTGGTEDEGEGDLYAGYSSDVTEKPCRSKGAWWAADEWQSNKEGRR